MPKYQSITTPGMQHDDFNAITELIFLNKFGNTGNHPWRLNEYRPFWSSTLAIVRKLHQVHGITPDQLAFYVFRCAPKELSSQEFAKAAVVAKKLFQKLNLEELINRYREKFRPVEMTGLEQASYADRTQPVASTQPKTLLELLKELENGKASQTSGGDRTF
jgi:hypothetical protein